MRDLIDDSLRTARIGAGVDLRLARVSMGDLLEATGGDVRDAADDRGVKLDVRSEKPDDIEVDRRLVSSAIENLVRNAVKFTRAGGTVSLRGRVEGDYAVVECEDECGGLAPGDVEQAFAPFVQLGKDRRGFGLGLAIAKQAADAHGGTVRVQNLPGKGCMFVLEIPVRKAGRDEALSRQP